MAKDDRAKCPECTRPMQTFLARRSPEQPAVQLDACRACGGVWLDRGELEAALGRPVVLDELELHPTLRCPRCTGPLRSARCGPYVEVDHCGKCRGFFLEEGELGSLGAHSAQRAASDATRSEVTFNCVKCFGDFPMAQGNAMGDELACPKCTPGLGKLLSEGRKPEEGRHKGWFGNRFAGSSGTGSVFSSSGGFFGLW